MRWIGPPRLPTMLLFTVLILVAPACATGEEPATLETRARAIDKQIMCPVCPGQSIAQTQNEYAEQMRTVVREKLAQGWTEEEIKQYFVERFGEQILMTPPKRGVHLVAWIGPFVVLVLAGGVLVYILNRMVGYSAIRQKDDLRPVGDVPEEYLRRLEEELERFD